MNEAEARRRLTALEAVELARGTGDDSRQQILDKFDRMIQSNVRTGNIWSAYEPEALRAELDRRIIELRAMADDEPDEPIAGVYLAIADWMTDARKVADDDINVSRPVMDCAERLHPLDNLSHVEILSLWFGLEAGADWHVADTIGHR